jgi:xanthine/uracil permease
VLWGVLAAAILYTLLAPTTWGDVTHASAFEGLHWMPFGFGVNGVAVVIFFVAWFPAISESIATYGLIADWTGEPLPARRITQGIFGELVGSTLDALFGGLPAMAYPANVGILKVTRVASRWVTFTTGLEILGRVRWTQDAMIAAGLPVIVGLGLLVGQPLVVSVLLAVVIVMYLGWRGDRDLAAGTASASASGASATSDASGVPARAAP